MSAVYRPLANAVSITTANDVFTGTVIHIGNQSNQSANVVFKYANGVQYASISINHDDWIVVEKDATDTLTGATCVATSIAWPKG